LGRNFFLYILVITYLIFSIIEIFLWQIFKSHSFLFANILLSIIQILVFIIFLVCSIRLIRKHWISSKLYSVIPLVTLIVINIFTIYFVPTVRFYYKKWYFVRNYNLYESIVYRISTKTKSDYKNWYLLSKNERQLSTGGKVWVIKKDQKINVLFNFSSTIGYADGMLYAPNGIIFDKPKVLEKSTLNWFYIEYD
jgi:hypothetical protein